MIQSKNGFRWMDLQINTYEVRFWVTEKLTHFLGWMSQSWLVHYDWNVNNDYYYLRWLLIQKYLLKRKA